MTGARPTGSLHIGQYLAAFRPFVEHPATEGSFFVVSDLHMLTTRFDPESTRGMGDRIRTLVAQALAFGVDPSQTHIYVQSSMPWQARFYVILQSLAQADELEAHSSYSEMARASERKPSLGLLGYPVLESSDVLAVGATEVTIGRNNVSHFEHLYRLLDVLRDGWGIDLVRPVPVVGADNMVGLDGAEKMSKSLGNAIYFVDDPDAIAQKISAMAPFAADGSVIAASYLAALGAGTEEVAWANERVHEGDPLGAVPPDVVDAVTASVVGLVDPVRRRTTELLADEPGIDALVREGGEAANDLGARNYGKFARALGFGAYA